MKKLPTTISNLREMIEDDYLYVDKTESILQLLKTAKYYFLSRPRRFGKTLLISTIKELFLGNRELFEHLWIGRSDYVWDEYPVIHLDFSNIAYDSVDNLKVSLDRRLRAIAREYSVSLNHSENVQDTLVDLVTALSAHNKVVILIDEYDFPILNMLDNLEQATANRNFLKGFFSTIKSLDIHLRFVFITGVTKFSKTSIFSGLNNLNDITLKPLAATLLGFSHSEIQTNFTEYINSFAQNKGMTSSEVLRDMATWYDGYCFSKNAEKVYNPFSVQFYLHDQEQDNYWFETGTPSFLISLIKQKNYSLEKLESVTLSEQEIKSFDLDNLPLILLLFQTGYLTIQDYDPELKHYSLGFPNREVERSFVTHIADYIFKIKTTLFESATHYMKKALLNNSLDDFMKELDKLLVEIPYHLHQPSPKLRPTGNYKEMHYQTIFYLIVKMMGFDVIVEDSTTHGRIDAVLDIGKRIFIFEFKINADGQQALDQIIEKRYYAKYEHKNIPVMLVGVGFDTTKCAVKNWVCKELSS